MVNLALCRIPVFLVGCFLAPKVKSGNECSIKIVLFAFLGSAVLALCILLFRDILEVYALWRYLYGVLGILVTIILAAVFHFLQHTYVYKVFRFFGKYTLELYLTHTQILSILKEQTNASTLLVNVLSVFS